MDGRVFYNQVAEHGELEWLGVGRGPAPAADEIYVGHRTTGTRFALPVEAILSREWDELEAVLTGKRPCRVLTHLTRIVGYFSKVHNWNRSKHAELADRRRGGYVLGSALQQRLPVGISAGSTRPKSSASTEPHETCEAGVKRAERQPASAA